MRAHRSGQAQFRAQLMALAEPATVTAVLDAWADGTVGHGGKWSRVFDRFHPDADPWAVLAFHSDRTVVRVDLHENAGEDRIAVDEVGYLRIRSALDDPGLPGLASAVATLTDVRVVRYRPGNRCTVSGNLTGRPCYIKVGLGPRQQYDDAVQLKAAADRGELGFAVAEPIAWDEQLAAFWQGTVPGGSVLPEVRGPNPESLVAKLGVALARLSRSLARPPAVTTPEDQLARTLRAVRGTERRVPELGPPLHEAVGVLQARHERLAARPLVPVHGAPHAQQWLDDEGRLGLIDFDRFAMGEPELDAATFLAELDFDNSVSVPVATLEKSMVDGYREGGVELDPARLELYRWHKRLAKVTRSARSLRPNGDERAALHLAAVRADLGLRNG